MQATTALFVAPGRIRKLAPIVVFLVSLGITVGFVSFVMDNFPPTSLIHRYTCGHPIEWCEVGLFIWGMSALAWKAWRLLAERGILGGSVVTMPAGRLMNVAEVPKLLASLGHLSGRKRDTWCVRRLAEALEYVLHRGSGEGLEERLEVLADRDADDLEGSYELVRNITWAIPILGFLGTVVGITIAIANITPEQLQGSLDKVVNGLAVAFDTTALALALSMVLVLGKFLVERNEKGVLTRVQNKVEDTLLHRFESHSPESHAFLSDLQSVAKVVLQSTRDAWREQGQLWTRTIEQIGESQVAALEKSAQSILEHSGQIGRQLVADQHFQYADILKRLEKLQEAGAGTITGLREVSREWVAFAREDSKAMAVTQETQFQQFLGGLDDLRQVCHKSLSDVAAKMTMHQATVKRQTELLAQLVADEGRLSKFQQALQNNISTLANVQALDEAIHSLSAAAHVLIMRASRVPIVPRLPVSDDPPMEEAA
jgi:biopolymer transport protein ExbB/TolQ